jgi:hypothetical protein
MAGKMMNTGDEKCAKLSKVYVHSAGILEQSIGAMQEPCRNGGVVPARQVTQVWRNRFHLKILSLNPAID